LCRNSRVNLATHQRSGLSSQPPSRSIAARANSSNVTIVDPDSQATEEELLPDCSEHQRLPRLNQNAIEEEPRAQVGEHTLDDIVLARRDSPESNSRSA